MDTKLAVLLILIQVNLIQLASAQDANCSYSTYAQPGMEYYMYSPNYPNSYGRSQTCRWVATTDANYNCRLNCQINLPQSNGCTMDRLLISRTGDLQLAGADVYCGSGNFVYTSVSNKISVGLLTSPFSTGGNFVCQLTAQSATVNPPAPCSCGWRKANRIVGGVETAVNEFPFMVGLMDLRIRQMKGGGAIISNRYVLTAGHCLVGHTTATLNVIAGIHDVRYVGAQSQTRQVNKLTIHQNFNPMTYDYDVGLVKTTADFVYNDVVGPICLPFKYETASFTGSRILAMGWGTQWPGGPSSNTLQKVDLDVISNSNCQARGQVVSPRQLCTYTPGKDSCQDDSGGPMVFTETGTGLYFSAAIVSYGALCAQYPAVNTRTTSYLSWIKANSDTSYCVK